ncbi:hypothetical protein GF345_05485 [Candidatus Woesearchaeota archaeon]|nr:hypothetical protein [Candidatus Woesearchaeota archaeon]
MSAKTEKGKEIDVVVYEATGRDGAQDPRSELNGKGRIEIAKELAKQDVPYFEAGYPEKNGELKVFKELYKMSLPLNVVAFGSTKQKDTKASEDPKLKPLIDARTPSVAIFGKTWLPHVEKVLKVTPEQNLDMIRDSIDFLKQKGKEVIYDLEHCFSGLHENEQYALDCIGTAIDAGSDWIVLCDTKGGVLPFDFNGRPGLEGYLDKLKMNFPDFRRFGFHGHEDSGVATANSLVFVKYILDNGMGLPMVHGTNYCGERCGNARLPEIIADLELKMSLNTGVNLKGLTDLSHRIAMLTGIDVPDNAPFVGRQAFADNAGTHVDSESKGATYRHVDPKLIGNNQDIVISDQSGEATAVALADKYGYQIDKRTTGSKDLIATIQDMEQAGYKLQGKAGENMEGEHYLLVESTLGEHRQYFFDDIFHTGTGSKHEADDEVSETTIRGFFSKTGNDEDKKDYHDVASSQYGAVSSQFRVIKKMVGRQFPWIKRIKLVNYSPKMVNKKGVDSTMRAYLEFGLELTNKEELRWGVVGLDEDLIAASYEGLKKGVT